MISLTGIFSISVCEIPPTFCLSDEDIIGQRYEIEHLILESTLTQYRPGLAKKVSPPIQWREKSTSYHLKIYTFENRDLFGTMIDGLFELSSLGQVVADEWVRSTHAHVGIALDAWLVLPDHLQAIVSIQDFPTASSYGIKNRKPRLLSSFIAGYKAAAAKRINLLRNAPGSPVWQRSYQERLIRDKISLERIRQLLLKQTQTRATGSASLVQ